MEDAKHPVLRAAGNLIHRLIAKSNSLTKAYLSIVGALLRGSPDFPLKSNIGVRISSFDWPLISFGKRRVSLCKDMEVEIVPHVGEFDFRALMYRELSYEQEVFDFLSSRMDQYDSIIEIGANVGVYTLFFCQYFKRLEKKGPIVSFEPSAYAYRRAMQNLELNNFYNVDLYNAAIGKMSGLVPFYEPHGHLSNGSMCRNFAEIFSHDIKKNYVLCLKGEEIAKVFSVGQKILLKIDVEGAELEVLESLKDFILMCHPDIVLEVLDLSENQLNSLEFLSDGYQFYNIQPGLLTPEDRFVATNYRDYFLIAKNQVDDRLLYKVKC